MPQTTKDERAAYMRRWRQQPHAKAQNRRVWLRHRYGITPEDEAEMFARQDGKCAICGEAPVEGQRLVIDHCHTEGVVRGMLCDPCNKGLGFFRDDPTRLAAALQYLNAK